jgi:hypothetical protein
VQPGRRVNTLPERFRAVVLPGSGHWVAEQAPKELLAALTTFLAPYRRQPAAERNSTSGADALG